MPPHAGISLVVAPALACMTLPGTRLDAPRLVGEIRAQGEPRLIGQRPVDGEARALRRAKLRAAGAAFQMRHELARALFRADRCTACATRRRRARRLHPTAVSTRETSARRWDRESSSARVAGEFLERGELAAAAVAHGVGELGPKSQKNRNGVDAANSSPMNSIGTQGASR